MVTDPFAACEDSVRRHDPDRFYAALFAPESARRHLFALYALYGELAHAAQAAREPAILAIRLAWWRDAIAAARAGRPGDHHVSQALAVVLAEHTLPEEPFARLIEARADEREGFADAAAAEAHAEATSGALMRLAAAVLGGEANEAAREAGIAYWLAGRDEERLHGAAALARRHYQAARGLGIPRALMPAFLPAALVPLYLKRRDPPTWRKQVALLAAALRGRI